MLSVCLSVCLSVRRQHRPRPYHTVKQLPLYGVVTMQVSEQGLPSPPTQYRASVRQFHRSKDPTKSIKELKEKVTTQHATIYC